MDKIKWSTESRLLNVGFTTDELDFNHSREATKKAEDYQ